MQVNVITDRTLPDQRRGALWFQARNPERESQVSHLSDGPDPSRSIPLTPRQTPACGQVTLAARPRELRWNTNRHQIQKDGGGL